MDSIGRYRIVRELGRGAGGVVYLGEDPKIGRNVAIKTISVAAAGASGETLRKRLQREARSAGSLAHPNIVTIFELDDEGPLTFVVMEFVEGVTLRDLMTKGQKMPLERILDLLRQVADGLDFAHGRAVVHRDIKPANIMVTSEHDVKIADFGVAKMLGDATMGLTQAGMAVGTPHYMSPEQVLGKPVTGQSDQFSLAVIAYELLAGARPFEGDSITSIMYQIVNEDPLVPSADGKPLAPPVLTALLRGLAKEPQDRYSTCRQLVDDLSDAVLYQRAPAPAVAAAPPVATAPPPEPAAPPPAPPPESAPEVVAAPIPPAPPASNRNRKVLLGAGVLVLILVAAATWALRPKTAGAPSTAEATPASESPQAAPPPAKAAPPVTHVPAPTPAPPKTAEKQNTEKPKAAAPDQTADAAADTKLGVHGTFTWSGALAAGDSVEIDDGKPAAGSVSGRMPPRHANIRIVEMDPPDVGVDQLPSAENGYTLRLVNSGRDVQNFSVTWRVARKGESTTE